MKKKEDLRHSLGAGHRSSNVPGNSSNTSGAIIPSSPCDHKERVSNLTHIFEVIQEVSSSSTNRGISENMHGYMLVEPLYKQTNHHARKIPICFEQRSIELLQKSQRFFLPIPKLIEMHP